MSFLKLVAVLIWIATSFGIWEWVFKPPRGMRSINWWFNPNFRWSVYMEGIGKHD